MGRPRLTLSVLTKNGEDRLPRVLAEAASYADQIVVGVDDASTDRTLEVAREMADNVYRFRLPRPGQLAPARMLPFDYANGDWILTLDDDESMEPSFDALVPELLRETRATHYYFPRKWIVAAAPYEYAHAAPWFPNWAPRMIRNDRSLVWKPAVPHSMYHLLGPARYEERTSILHFEPILCDAERRGEKVRAYRAAGATLDSERFYAIPLDTPRRPVHVRDGCTVAPRPACAVVDERVHALTAPVTPPWAVAFERVEMPATVGVDERPVVTVTARNTGALAWSPTYAQPPARNWPMLRLGYHLRSADGEPLRWDGGGRTEIQRHVAPGESIALFHVLETPQEPGEYVLDWDLVSEGDVWFSACGSDVYSTPLTVTAARQTAALETWSSLERDQAEEWSGRAAFAAAMLGPIDGVADMGCGFMTLERHLAPGTQYVPVDIVARDARTIVCDFNAGPPPSAPVTAAVCLGLIGYLHHPDRFLASLRRSYRRAIVSYKPIDLEGAPADRRALRLANDMSTAEIEALFREAGWVIDDVRRFDAEQMIWRLSSESAAS